jgi:hypothetical protein
MKTIYSGVIPYAYDKNGVIRYLLGYEYPLNSNERNKYNIGWSGFGGSLEPKESEIDAAAREAHEESMGFLGTISQIKKKLHDDQLIIETGRNGKRAFNYLIEVPYDSNLPKYYKRVYDHFRKIIRQVPEGYMEKSKIKWFTDIQLNQTTNYRSSFRKTKDSILSR